MKRIYLDHNATTPVRPEVVDVVARMLGEFGGNPSSSYESGRRAKEKLEEARAGVAGLFGAEPAEVLFCASGTEADNLALRGVAFAGGLGEIVVSTVEHPAIEEPARLLEKSGFRVHRIGVGSDGLVDPERFAAALGEKTRIASLIHGQNETGIVQPVEAVGRHCREKGVPLHVDAAQTAGKFPIDLRRDPIDLLTVVGHKIYGPKGIAALIVRGDFPLRPILLGGGQEGGRRPGTESVAFAAGLAAALEIALSRRDEEERRIGALRDHFEMKLIDRVDGVEVLGRGAPRIPGTSYVLLGGVSGGDVAAELDRRGLEVSTGSACHSGSPEPSATVLAMGIERDRALSGIRVGFGIGNETADADRLVNETADIVGRLRAER